MASDEAKKFEKSIESAFKKYENTTIIRLKDTMGRYKGNNNPCDYIGYCYPVIYYIECKVHHGNTLPFTAIRECQWDGLSEVSGKKGVASGVVWWAIDHDKTMFIPIDLLVSMRESGAKSFNIKDIGRSGVVEIQGIKKRKYYDYDMDSLFNSINL